MQAAVERVSESYQQLLQEATNVLECASRRSAGASDREEAVARALEALTARVQSFHAACNAAQKAVETAKDGVVSNSVMDSARGAPMPLHPQALASPGVAELLAEVAQRQVAAAQVALLAQAAGRIREQLGSGRQEGGGREGEGH